MAEKKKQKKKGRVALVIIAVVAILAVALSLLGKSAAEGMYVDDTAVRRDILTYYTFTGNVEPEDSTDVLANVSQKVLSVNVKEGDEVKEGDIIAVLDSTDIEKSITMKEMAMSSSDISDSYNLRSAKEAYEDYKAQLENGTNTQLNAAKTSLDNAAQTLEDAKKRYEDSLADSSDETDTTIINARTNVENAKKDMESAKKDYDNYSSGLANGTNTQLNSARSSVENAKTALDNAKEKYEEARTELSNSTDPVLVNA
ncbi:MAG: TolC family protein, partial [Huintestinicola sp.]